MKELLLIILATAPAFVDPTGKIISKGLHGKDLTDKLEQLFIKI